MLLTASSGMNSIVYSALGIGTTLQTLTSWWLIRYGVGTNPSAVIADEEHGAQLLQDEAHAATAATATR